MLRNCNQQVQYLLMVKVSQKTAASVKKDSKDRTKNNEQKNNLKLSNSQLRKMIIKRWKGDTEHKRRSPVNQQQRENKEESFQKLLEQMKEEYLSCPICLDFCIYPVLTECGHYYCLPCFEQAHRLSDTCCVCRSKINTSDYEPDLSLRKLFQEFIRTQIDWSEAEIYWNRQRELLRRQSRRSLSDIIRIGQMVDFRLNKIWMEAKIVSVQDRNIEVLCFDLDNKQEVRVTVSKNSRALARHRSFTVDPKTLVEGKKNPPSVISIFVRPFRRRRANQVEEEGVEPALSERELEAILTERERRSNWEEDLRVIEEDNINTWLFEESDPAVNNQVPNIWDLTNLVEEDQEEDNFFQLVL